MDGDDILKENHLEDEEEFVNPVAPKTLDKEDNDLLRGDAIGDTAYTHRWILSCLLTIVKNLPNYLKGLDKKDNDQSDEHSLDSIGDQKSWRKAIDSNSQPSIDGTQSEDGGSTSGNSNENTNEEDSKGSKESNENILELDEEVEEAACQLWDMTVERDVVIHLIQLTEVDFLQLTSHILLSSKSPRLNEVVAGIIANVCCQKEGCEIVFDKHQYILDSAFELFLSTDDVPTLCELVRLMKLLLWHRLNRTPQEEISSCPLISKLKEKSAVQAFTFSIQNCLNENFLNSTFEFLESLLFVKTSESSSVADNYATEDMVNCLLQIFSSSSLCAFDPFSKETEKSYLHKVINCLYAFVDTPISTYIQQKEMKNNILLPQLCSYIQKIGSINSSEELIGEMADRLIFALGLCTLLIPCTKSGLMIQIVAHLLALTRGHMHHYTASRSNSTEEDAKYMDGDPGWLSPEINRSLPAAEVQNRFKNKDIKEEDSIIPELADLDDSLCDYCGELFNHWWQQNDKYKICNVKSHILKKLDECHANEVLLVFKAIRSRKPDIVPILQEYLLDVHKHTRLVSLLAYMYE